MIEFLFNEFNYQSFFLALVLFFLVGGIFQVIFSYIRLQQARRDVDKAEAKLLELHKQLGETSRELADKLKIGGKE